MPKVFADNRGGASGLDGETVDLTSPANDDLIQRKSGQWVNRTPAQVKTDLALTKSDVGLGNVTNDAQLPLAGGTMVGELDFDLVSGGSMNLRNGGLILDDDYPNFSLGYGLLTGDQLDVLRADARQIIRPMDFVGVSKTITLYGAHDATQTTVTMTVIGSGTSIQNAFTNLFFPKTFVIREGQADEEHIVCPSPPTNVASNRWQFTNVMRGYPLAGGTGQAHAASASTREVDNQYRMNGWAIPVYDREGNYTQIAYHGQSDTSDTANPIKVFLPPRIAVGTWSPPSYITGENLSVFFVMRESSTDHHVEIWEPYDNKKVIDFPLGKQARYAEIMHHAQTGTYIYHSIVGGDVA